MLCYSTNRPGLPRRPTCIPPCPSSARQERELGNEAYAARQWDAAVAHYSKAISLRGVDASLWSNRAAAYLAKGW